jgi:hypothetical protein
MIFGKFYGDSEGIGNMLLPSLVFLEGLRKITETASNTAVYFL